MRLGVLGVGAAFCSLCATSCSTSPPPSPRTTPYDSPTGPLATCSASTLAIRLSGEISTAGLVSLEYEVRNTGAVGCNVSGFPSLQMIDASDASLPTTVSDDTTRTALSVALPAHTRGLGVAGATGHAWFTVSYSDSSCPAAVAEIPVRWRLAVPGVPSTVEVTARDASGALPLVCGGMVTVKPFSANP